MIAELVLSHFRSHRHLRLVFDGRPAVFFGPNGAGKTNILEAASLLSPGRGLRRAAGDEIARRPEAVGWKLRARIAASGQAHVIETWGDAGTRGLRIDDKPAPQSALGHVLRVLWLVPAMDRLWLEGAEGRRRFLDRAALSLMPDHAEAAVAYERAMRERNRLLRDQIGDPRWHAAIEAQMVAAADRLAANRRSAVAELVAAQAGAGGAFPNAALALVNEAGPDDGPALAAALAEGRRRDMAAGRTLAGPHRADLEAVYAAKAMPAAQCSTGEQKALLIALVLSNARAVAARVGTAPVLLLDEVAAHLDPGRRAALFDELVALGAQAMLTGTEAALFDALGARGQRFAVVESGGESRVEPA